MISNIWHNWLYVPLLNFLIILYNGPAFYNLGLAVIYLTILLRLLLLPFSIISERNSYKYENVLREIKTLRKDFKDDPVAQRERIREILKEQKISPWASVILLGIQALFLFLLYQVFIGGMNTEKLSLLYPSISRPDVVNVIFLGLDLSKPSYLASGLVAGWLFLDIWKSQRLRKGLLEKKDILFRYLFPLTVFLLLAFLPSVKDVFILTSMAFSSIVHLGRPLFVRRLQIEKRESIGK
jgi:YidC/Oxa1 family membrane protein insertase